MKKKFLQVIVFCLIFSTIFSICVSAQTGTSFSHFETADDVITITGRNMFDPVDRIMASDLNLEEALAGMTDIFVDDENNIYILCGEKSKIYILNPDHTLKTQVIVSDESGKKVDFTGAQAIYVSKRGETFIMDTENARILLLDSQGTIIKSITLPESDLIPDGFLFSPVAMSEDNDGNYYILSQGSYYGAMIYSSELEFTGFYGANIVQYSVLDTLSYLWDLLTNTDAKRAKKTRLLPTSFVDLASDKDGYIYTCTGLTSAHNTTNGTGQITMLSPGGSNILKRRDAKGNSILSSEYNFLESPISNKSSGRFRLQNLIAIDINDDNLIFALDQVTGFIYIYDEDCNLLGTFGGGIGEGDKLGEFKSAAAMAISGEYVYVADYKKNTVDVFKINDYGKLLTKAQALYREGNYSDAKPLWKEVLLSDQNNQYAYRGLAKAYYTEGNYKKTMEYAEKVFDYATYDQAYSHVKTSFTQKNFILIFAIAIVFVVLIVVGLIKIKKRTEPMIKNVKVHAMATVPLHPFAAFTNIKQKNQGSVLYAIIITLLFTVTSNVKATMSGFLFKTADANNYNLLYTFAKTTGLIVLWSVSNWLVGTLLEGKGTLKETFTSSSYCMIPYVLFNVSYTVLSYLLSYEDIAFLNILYFVTIIYTLYLICVSMMTIHEYTFGKFIITTVITLFLMILVVFIIFMVVILLQQLGNFVYTIYMEVAYR